MTAHNVSYANRSRHKARRRQITTTTPPKRDCPVCGKPVVKVVMYGQLSYDCTVHWGPWDEAKVRSE